MLIGISGKSGSGKDTVADFIIKHFGFTKVCFADPIKRFCKDIFGWDRKFLWGSSNLRNLKDHRYLIPNTEEELSPRVACQFIGGGLRDNCYKDVWVDYLIDVCEKLNSSKFGEYYKYSPEQGLVGPSLFGRKIKGVVVTDVRYFNEINKLKQNNAKLIKIIRPDQNYSDKFSKHLSELEQDSFDNSIFDLVINNDKDQSHLESLIIDYINNIKI